MGKSQALENRHFQDLSNGRTPRKVDVATGKAQVIILAHSKWEIKKQIVIKICKLIGKVL